MDTSLSYESSVWQENNLVWQNLWHKERLVWQDKPVWQAKIVRYSKFKMLSLNVQGWYDKIKDFANFVARYRKKCYNKD